jgi:hypothetical protein
MASIRQNKNIVQFPFIQYPIQGKSIYYHPYFSESSISFVEIIGTTWITLGI